MIRGLDSEEAEIFWEAITVIEAQETLTKITAAQWDKLSQKDRQKIHKNLYKSAYPESFNKQIEIKTEDLARILRGG